MAMCRQVLRINTKIEDFEEIKRLVALVIEFADENAVHLSVGIDDEDGKLYSDCRVRGQSVRYCKALAAEVKEMLRQAFHCKLEVVFHAW